MDGKLKTQTDAKGQTTVMQYDVLGRMISRTDHDGVLSTWSYDQGNQSLGKLSSETGLDGYTRSIIYDSLGRPSTVTTRING